MANRDSLCTLQETSMRMFPILPPSRLNKVLWEDRSGADVQILESVLYFVTNSIEGPVRSSSHLSLVTLRKYWAKKLSLGVFGMLKCIVA